MWCICSIFRCNNSEGACLPINIIPYYFLLPFAVTILSESFFQLMDKSHWLEVLKKNMGTFLFLLSLFWLRVVQPEENWTNNKAQFSFLHAVDIFPLPMILGLPFCFSTMKFLRNCLQIKQVLIQNKAALSPSIFSNYINCSALAFVQSSQCRRLVNREESKEDASNLQISKKEKSKRRKQPLNNNLMNPLLSNLPPLRCIPSPEMTLKHLPPRG